MSCLKYFSSCQSFVVLFKSTLWSWGILTVPAVVFHLLYMLLHWFKHHAECERKPFTLINIYDDVIKKWLQCYQIKAQPAMLS